MEKESRVVLTSRTRYRKAVFHARLGGCRHAQKHPWASVRIMIVEGWPDKEFGQRVE